jgi:hypothetical protein
MAGLVLLAKSSTGKLTRLQLAPDATVGQLKRELAERFCAGASPRGSEATMRVRAGGQLLVPDDARLRELGVASQQLLHVDLDPAGGRAPNGEAGAWAGEGRMSASAHEATAVLDEPAWTRLTAKVDAVASELEGWTREQINRLQACCDGLLDRLSQLELKTAQAAENAARMNEMHAKLQALEAKVAAGPARTADFSLSPELASRLAGMDEKLASVLTAERPGSWAVAVEELRKRLLALENRPPSSTNRVGLVVKPDETAQVSELRERVKSLEESSGLMPGKADCNQSSNADLSGSGASGMETRLTDLEGSMKTLQELKLVGLDTTVKGLEEKVKDLRKLSQQIIKQQRQRAVAQGKKIIIHVQITVVGLQLDLCCVLTTSLGYALRDR